MIVSIASFIVFSNVPIVLVFEWRSAGRIAPAADISPLQANKIQSPLIRQAFRRSAVSISLKSSAILMVACNSTPPSAKPVQPSTEKPQCSG